MTPTLGPASAPSRGGPARTALFWGVGLAIILLLYTVARANKGVHVAAPTAFVPYTAADKSFMCEAPAGWHAEGIGAEGGQGSRTIISQGDAVITLRSNASASTMADMMNATNAQQQQAREDLQNMPGGPPAGMPAPPPPVPAVQQLHKMNRESLAAKYEDFTETATHPFQGRLGDARLNEWTGAGDMGARMHGYRVTMLTQDKMVTLVCRCRETDWKALQPAFVRIIHSVDRGPG